MSDARREKFKESRDIKSPRHANSLRLFKDKQEELNKENNMAMNKKDKKSVGCFGMGRSK